MDPINHSGGIVVLWNNNGIHAPILSKEQRAIHLLVHDDEKNQKCHYQWEICTSTI